MAFSDSREWNAYWISSGAEMVDWRAKVLPAPWFRKEFRIDREKSCEAFVCGLGYHEIWLNGQRVGNAELAPAPTNYDRHAGYLRYDISAYLKPGLNTVGAVLGNGLYNCHTTETWHFDKATWRDYPKILLEIVADGQTVLSSDDTWKVSTDGPITFDGLRNGEYYDARLELPGWSENGFDDSAWNRAVITAGPGGLLFEQTAPPCRVRELFPMKEIRPGLLDAGVNIAGRAELTVRGVRGSEIRIQYGDVLNPDGSLHLDDIARFIKSGEFQTERYILKGGGAETWHSRFTYHGFRYAAVEISGDAEILSMTAQVIGSDLAETGGFSCSHPDLNELGRCTRRSILNNFVGIPTDCPHREKNGWINDHQLASDSVLFQFDASELYREFLGTLRDCQRPNGQLPGMAPTSGWGYNWGSGPLFDNFLLGVPRNVYIYRGDSSLLRENYDAFKRNLQFTKSLAKDGIVRFGLGDWCHYDRSRAVAPEFVTTAWYFRNLKFFAETASLFGFSDDAARTLDRAAKIADSFRRNFFNGGGSWANDEKTALALPVAFGLCDDAEARLSAALLDRKMREDECIADFGIVGAKFVPRVLADYGYENTAFRIFTQEKFPGWCKWIRDGETALLEDFAGHCSHSHVMYGDLAAWMMQYPGGIEPSFTRPGFREVVLKPKFIDALHSMNAHYDSFYGRISVSWARNASGIELTVSIPPAIPGTLFLQDGTSHAFSRTQHFQIG